MLKIAKEVNKMNVDYEKGKILLDILITQYNIMPYSKRKIAKDKIKSLKVQLGRAVKCINMVYDIQGFYDENKIDLTIKRKASEMPHK